MKWTKIAMEKGEAEKEWNSMESGDKGDFIQYIAKAFVVADEVNLKKLSEAFSEIAEIYNSWKH